MQSIISNDTMVIIASACRGKPKRIMALHPPRRTQTKSTQSCRHATPRRRQYGRGEVRWQRRSLKQIHARAAGAPRTEPDRGQSVG
jgi:hypothetical protein